MTDLQRGVVSITTTKRRRFWWVAWWTAEPRAAPFRPPDAFEGGARTRDEAKRAAEQAAGRPLAEIEPKWARAWVRVRAGQPAFRAPEPARPAPPGDEPAKPSGPAPNPSARAVLGVGKDASDDEIKRAFRALALATHPDRGGDAEAFVKVKRAYDALLGQKPRLRRRGTT
ncbi:MAG TPA: J domain-containing protein [Polyangiaceae bacterium]|nr:J domain-containing protein [Polyangiaceae bacterium]